MVGQEEHLAGEYGALEGGQGHRKHGNGVHEEGEQGPSPAHAARRPALVGLILASVALACVAVSLSTTSPGGSGDQSANGLQLLLSGLMGRPVLPYRFDVRWGFAQCRGFEPITLSAEDPCNSRYAFLVSFCIPCTVLSLPALQD